MTMSYAGRHVIVTGGSSGIGRATAGRFADAGARVTIIARRVAPLTAAVTTITARLTGPVPRILARSADVADRVAITAAIDDACAEQGPADILVCCAGVAEPGYFGDLTAATFENAMRVNYFGTLHAVQAVLAGMVAREYGRIILVASGAALLGLFGYGAYGPSKFAVRGLAETLRAETAGTGVRVSVLYPPDVDTPQLAAENRAKPAELRAIGRQAAMWTADETARLIVRSCARRRFVLTKGLSMTAMVHLHSVLAPVLRCWFDRVARQAAHAPRLRDAARGISQ
jgi:3-dehydrosphinganine reductase